MKALVFVKILSKIFKAFLKFLFEKSRAYKSVWIFFSRFKSILNFTESQKSKLSARLNIFENNIFYSDFLKFESKLWIKNFQRFWVLFFGIISVEIKLYKMFTMRMYFRVNLP